MKPPDAPPPHHRGGADSRSIPDQRNRSQVTSEVVAAGDIRGAAARLSLRAAALGVVDFDDLLDLVRATGRLCDIMVGAR
jgi:hypothetical protein